MADLYEEGYLSQPHTSAGRVPTEKAFQSYIKTLTARRMMVAELHRIRTELSGIEGFQARVEHTSHLLMEMTRGLGIAAAFPGPDQMLDQIELIALAQRRILMIVATRDHMVHNRVVAMNETVSQDELHSIRNYINTHFAGWLLPDIRRELQVRLAHERAMYDSILRRLHVLYGQGLLDVGLTPEVYVDGASNLIGLDLHLTREKMRDLFRALEEKKKILHLLQHFLEEPQGELVVRIGLGQAHPSMAELAIIGVNVELPGGIAAKFAVIGPMRMDYQRVISAVRHVEQAFSKPQA